MCIRAKCSLERGSVKEGANRDPGMDYGEDDELHVLITGDTNEEVDRAAGTTCSHSTTFCSICLCIICDCSIIEYPVHY